MTKKRINELFFLISLCLEIDVMKQIIRTHNELEVYQIAFKTAQKIHQLTIHFPIEERYSLTDQIRRSSRSVAANLAEAYRKRRYPKAFISKLSDAEGEAAETQVWLQFARSFGYLSQDEEQQLSSLCDQIIGKIVTMINAPEKWSL